MAGLVGMRDDVLSQPYLLGCDELLPPYPSLAGVGQLVYFSHCPFLVNVKRQCLSDEFPFALTTSSSDSNGKKLMPVIRSTSWMLLT